MHKDEKDLLAGCGGCLLVVGTITTFVAVGILVSWGWACAGLGGLALVGGAIAILIAASG